MKKIHKKQAIYKISVQHHTQWRLLINLSFRCISCSLGNLKLNISWHSDTILISLVKNNFIKNWFTTKSKLIMSFYLKGKHLDHRAMLLWSLKLVLISLFWYTQIVFRRVFNSLISYTDYMRPRAKESLVHYNLQTYKISALVVVSPQTSLDSPPVYGSSYYSHQRKCTDSPI